MEELKARVDSDRGLSIVLMSELRELTTAKKLGMNVCGDISEGLRRAGLGHHPSTLPVHGTEQVFVHTNEWPFPATVARYTTDLELVRELILMDCEDELGH